MYILKYLQKCTTLMCAKTLVIVYSPFIDFQDQYRKQIFITVKQILTDNILIIDFLCYIYAAQINRLYAYVSRWRVFVFISKTGKMLNDLPCQVAHDKWINVSTILTTFIKILHNALHMEP